MVAAFARTRESRTLTSPATLGHDSANQEAAASSCAQFGGADGAPIGERVEGSESRVDLRQIEEIKGIKENDFFEGGRRELV